MARGSDIRHGCYPRMAAGTGIPESSGARSSEGSQRREEERLPSTRVHGTSTFAQGHRRTVPCRQTRPENTNREQV